MYFYSTFKSSRVDHINRKHKKKPCNIQNINTKYNNNNNKINKRH